MIMIIYDDITLLWRWKQNIPVTIILARAKTNLIAFLGMKVPLFSRLFVNGQQPQVSHVPLACRQHTSLSSPLVHNQFMLSAVN